MTLTIVSAPGKVLLAGGYLVLDRAYTGLVFGLSARIHVVVRDIETQPGVKLSDIVVKSPQFRDAQWRYGYHLTDADGGVQVTQLLGYVQVQPSSLEPPYHVCVIRLVFWLFCGACFATSYISSFLLPRSVSCMLRLELIFL